MVIAMKHPAALANDIRQTPCGRHAVREALVFLSTLILLASVAGKAPADTGAQVELTGTVHSTGISGYPGSKFTLGDADSDSRGLVGVLSRERSDKPCFVSAGWEDVNKSSTNGAATKDLCGKKGPSSGTMGGTYANTGGNANRVFVTGAQVCMNKGDDRVKGIHLRGQRINDAGELVNFGPDAQDSRTNCHQDHWKRWVECPAGQIATAAIIHYSAGDTPRSWTGIGLQCRAIKSTGASTTLTTEASTLDSVTDTGPKALTELPGCNDTEALDIRAVAWNIADDWAAFSRKVERQSGTNLGACIERRFAGDGKVECAHEYKCKQNGTKCKLGLGGGLGSKIKLYQTFFDNIAGKPQPDRRACYAALMTHEFSHTCEHYAEGGPEARAEAAFDYWKERFAVSSSWTIDGGCGMND